MMIGAKDLAFPRLNLLSWYLYMFGAAWTLYAMIAGGVDTGWTFYTPYSSQSSHYNVVPTMIGIVIAGFSSLLTGLNFIVTTHWLRAPGMTWFRLPIFVWTLYATSFIFLLAVPVLAMALILVVVERMFQIGIFDPGLGGDPLLFQHLFWFYSHPAVYIMILPGMGIVSEVIPCFARKQLFGYTFVAFASFGIACFGFLVWAHHMFVAGISIYAALVFSSLSFLVAVPSAIKVFNWTATLYKGSITFEAPMLFALGFVALFTVGGLTGLFLATLGMDMHVHDTYFVIAHFHFIMVGGMVMAYMARAALLVAEDDRPDVSEWWSRLSGADHLRRLLPDVPAAVRRRLQRHAAALSQLRSGVPGLERAVDGRGLDPRAWATCCRCAICCCRCDYGKPRRPQSLARDGAGMADALAAAARRIST